MANWWLSMTHRPLVFLAINTLDFVHKNCILRVYIDIFELRVKNEKRCE